MVFRAANQEAFPEEWLEEYRAELWEAWSGEL
jgi:hypothetical protein